MTHPVDIVIGDRERCLRLRGYSLSIRKIKIAKMTNEAEITLPLFSKSGSTCCSTCCL